MASLATALMATGTEFSNELTYVPGMAPRSVNCPAFEKGGMQVTYASWLSQILYFLLLFMRLQAENIYH